jgi:hypothetical protein
LRAPGAVIVVIDDDASVRATRPSMSKSVDLSGETFGSATAVTVCRHLAPLVVSPPLRRPPPRGLPRLPWSARAFRVNNICCMLGAGLRLA